MSFHLYLYPQAVSAINYNFTNWGKSSLSQCAFGSRAFCFSGVIPFLRIQSFLICQPSALVSPVAGGSPQVAWSLWSLGGSAWPRPLFLMEAIPAHSLWVLTATALPQWETRPSKWLPVRGGCPQPGSGTSSLHTLPPAGFLQITWVWWWEPW